jgi:phage FluMu protein Com
MPIEFRCSKCGKLLRTGDDTAGRQAQCPECGTIGTVPSPTPPDEGGLPGPGYPFAGPPGVQSPCQPAGACGLEAPAAERVVGPAIALIVTAVLNLLTHLAQAAIYTTMIIIALNGQMQDQEKFSMVLGGAIIVAGSIFGLILDCIVMIGAVKMKNLTSYAFAMAAAIVAMFPCSLCWPLGLAFGIWALVALSDNAVKAAFRR